MASEFREFYLENFANFVSFAFLVGNFRTRAEAEDIVQEVLVKVLPHWSSIQEPRGYVLSAIRRAAWASARRSRMYRAVLSEDIAEMADPSDELALHEAGIWVNEILGTLPPRQREAVALHYQAGLPIAEVSERMEMSPVSVRSTLRHAREKLRRYIGDDPAGPDAGPVWPRGSLLADFPDAARADLLTLGTVARYPPGTALIRQGDSSTDVFVLESGVVKVTIDTEDGAGALVAVRVAGDAVGELEALDLRPRLARVTAVGAVRARRLGRDAFLAFLARYPSAAAALTKSVNSKFRWATRRRIDFDAFPVLIRLARLLDELAGRHGYPAEGGLAVGVELTQPELAALVGATEPSVHRALRQLRTGGALRTGYRQLVITDLDGLRRYGQVSDG
jgi:RNA polymerase sigma factor (sigma-70 family)